MQALCLLSSCLEQRFPPLQSPAGAAVRVRPPRGHQGRRAHKVDELAQRLPEGGGAGDGDAGPQEDHKGRGRQGGEQVKKRGNGRKKERYDGATELPSPRITSACVNTHSFLSLYLRHCNSSLYTISSLSLPLWKENVLDVHIAQKRKIPGPLAMMCLRKSCFQKESAIGWERSISIAVFENLCIWLRIWQGKALRGIFFESMKKLSISFPKLAMQGRGQKIAAERTLKENL